MKVQRIKTTGKYNSVLELIKRVNSMYYRGCMNQGDVAKKTKTSRYIVRKILNNDYVVYVQFRDLRLTVDVFAVTFDGDTHVTICELEGVSRSIDWIKENMKVVQVR